MGFSFSHILLVLVVVLIVFGAGKLPKIMGDFGKGLKAFKDGMHDDEADTPRLAKAKVKQDKNKRSS